MVIIQQKVLRFNEDDGIWLDASRPLREDFALGELHDWEQGNPGTEFRIVDAETRVVVA